MMRHAVFAATLIVACSPALDIPEGATITCEGNEDCPEGHTCRTGAKICVSDNVDLTQPGIVEGSVVLNHDLVRAGVEVTVSFDTTLDLARAPAVRLAAATQIAWELESESGRSYSFSYIPNGEEGDGFWQIVADLTSTKGILSKNLGVAGIRLDFIDPAPANASALITPPAHSTLRTARRAGDGSGIRIWAPTSEPVVVDPAAELEIVCGQRRESLSLLPTSTPTLLVFDGDWACTGFERVDCHYEIDLEDLAGNRADDVEVPGLTLEIDCEPPPDSIDMIALKHLRVPWGSDETQSVTPSPVGQFLVRNDYATGDDLLADISGSAFDLTSDDIAQALVLGGSDEILGIIERTDSGWGAIRLSTSDSPEVYLQVVDSAGNVSSKRVVENSEWVATFGNKRVGSILENPHRFVFRPAFAEDVRLAGTEGAAGLVAADNILETGVGSASWARTSDADAPTNRISPTTAHDSLRGVTVLFGGHNPLEPGPVALYNDTWEHNGRIWLARTPTDFEGDSNPAGRTMQTMAYDERRGVTVMAGGCVAYTPTTARDWTCVAVSDELWEWDGERWQLRCDGVPADDVCTATPPARFAATAAYDAERGVVAMYGGCLNGACTGIDDTLWLWDGNDWTEHAAQSPGMLYGASAAFDRLAREVVLFGGVGSGINGASASGATWTWDGSWSSAGSTSGRLFGGMTWDPTRQGVVRFGGMDTVHACEPNDPSTSPRNLYRWTGSAWQDLGVLVGLTALRGWCVGLVHQGNTGNTIMSTFHYFTGFEGVGTLAESMNTFRLTADDTTWVLMRQDAIPQLPLPAVGAAAAYDSSRGTPVVVGGFSDAPWYIGSLGWTSCDPSGMGGFPCDTLDLKHQGFIFDHTNNRLVTHGGDNVGAVSTTHSWSWMEYRWVPITTVGNPTGRYKHVFTEGPGGNLVAFGGVYRGFAIAETCVLSGTTWSCPSLSTGSTEPGIRANLAAAYHEAADIVVAFGGSTWTGDTGANEQRLDDTWVFDGSRWYQVSTSVRPLAREGHIMAYDAARQEIVMAFGDNKDDTWVFRSGTTVGQGEWRQLVPADPEWDGDPRYVNDAFSWVEPEGIVVAGYFGDDDYPEFWLYRGNGEERPAAMAQFRVGSQVRLDSQRVDALEITWVGGASADIAGVDLMLWRDNQWQLLTESTSATASALETLTFIVEDVGNPDWADVVLVGEPAAIYVALVPKGVNGNLADYARIATDYIELRLRLGAR